MRDTGVWALVVSAQPTTRRVEDNARVNLTRGDAYVTCRSFASLKKDKQTRQAFKRTLMSHETVQLNHEATA